MLNLLTSIATRQQTCPSAKLQSSILGLLTQYCKESRAFIILYYPIVNMLFITADDLQWRCPQHGWRKRIKFDSGHRNLIMDYNFITIEIKILKCLRKSPYQVGTERLFLYFYYRWISVCLINNELVWAYQIWAYFYIYYTYS